MNKLIDTCKQKPNKNLNMNMNLPNNPDTTLSKIKANSRLSKLLFDLSHDNIGLLDSHEQSREPEESEVIKHKKQ